MFVDNGAALRQFLFAVVHVLAHNRFEVVNVVEVNIFDLLHCRIDVARHGNVDQEQRTIPPGRHQFRHVSAM